MTEPSPPDRPRRSLVFGPRRLSRLLWHRSVLASLAASGRQLVTVTHGEAPRADHAGVLEPTLMRWRLEYTPHHLDAPLSLGRDELDVDRLRRLEVDEAVVLDRRWQDPRLAAAAGIGSRWGYRGGLSGLLCRPRVPAPALDDRHVLDEGRELVAAMGLPWVELPTLDVPKVWQKAGPDRLQAAKLDLDAPLVGVHLGDTEGAGTAWPGEAFEELVRQLRRERPAIQVVILATERELWQSVLLFEQTGKIHPVIGPDLALDGLAAVLAHLDVVITSDSWMLHLAAAVGTSTLGLYPSGASRTAPHGDAHRVIERRRLKRVAVEEVLSVAVDRVDASAESNQGC